jgi:nucleotide-binding universal stress UspA family protein
MAIAPKLPNPFGGHPRKQGNNTILVPVNDSIHSEHAFRWACHAARKNKDKLHALHVIEVPLSLSIEAELSEDLDRAERLLEKFERIAHEEKYRGLEAGCLRGRQAGSAIVSEAENKRAVMIVVGIPYSRSLGQHRMGSSAAYIFEHAPCQVLLWRDTAPVAIFKG